MRTEITNKNEMNVMISTLMKDSRELDSVVSDLKRQVSRNHNYDGIDVRTPGNILKNNLEQVTRAISKDSRNINNFSNGIEILDKDNFNIFGYALNSVKNFFNNDLGFISTGIRNVSGSLSNCYRYLTGGFVLNRNSNKGETINDSNEL